MDGATLRAASVRSFLALLTSFEETLSLGSELVAILCESGEVVPVFESLEFVVQGAETVTRMLFLIVEDCADVLVGGEFPCFSAEEPFVHKYEIFIVVCGLEQPLFRIESGSFFTSASVRGLPPGLDCRATSFHRVRTRTKNCGRQ